MYPNKWNNSFRSQSAQSNTKHILQGHLQQQHLSQRYRGCRWTSTTTTYAKRDQWHNQLNNYQQHPCQQFLWWNCQQQPYKKTQKEASTYDEHNSTNAQHNISNIENRNTTSKQDKRTHTINKNGKLEASGASIKSRNNHITIGEHWWTSLLQTTNDKPKILNNCSTSSANEYGRLANGLSKRNKNPTNIMCRNGC